MSVVLRVGGRGSTWQEGGILDRIYSHTYRVPLNKCQQRPVDEEMPPVYSDSASVGRGKTRGEVGVKTGGYNLSGSYQVSDFLDLVDLK